MTGQTVGALFLGVALHPRCLIKFPVMDTEMSPPVFFMLESSSNPLSPTLPFYSPASFFSLIGGTSNSRWSLLYQMAVILCRMSFYSGDNGGIIILLLNTEQLTGLTRSWFITTPHASTRGRSVPHVYGWSPVEVDPA